MDIYVAMSDPTPGAGTPVGVFTSEPRARQACSEDAGRELTWVEDATDDKRYSVLLYTLDEAI